MSKIKSLIVLINSLTKGEKKKFRMHSLLQDGDKDYLLLYDCILAAPDPLLIKNIYFQKRGKENFEMTSSYLYDLLLNVLVQVRMETSLQAQQLNELQKADILFEKGLFEEAFKLLNKIQLIANKHELRWIHLLALGQELNYISDLGFLTITEAALIQKQMTLRGAIQYAEKVTDHIFLYQLLHHRLLYKGKAATIGQKNDLNDLVVSEIHLANKQVKRTFESKKIHLLFQSYYFIVINDYHLALLTFKELNTLFETYTSLWKESPIDYLQTLEGILDSLRSMKRYDEMDFYLEKIDTLTELTGHNELNRKRILYTYTLIRLLDRGEFEAAAHFDSSYSPILFKSIHSLDINKQAELHLCRALVYFGVGNFKQANGSLNAGLYESRQIQRLPIYWTILLLHLLVQCELKNFDYIKHQLRGLKRGFNKLNLNEPLYKVVIKFIEAWPIVMDNNKEKTKFWKQIKVELDKIEGTKFGNFQLKIFNFGAYIEAKLCEKSFSTVLKQFITKREH